jgi:hypothetical protein
MRLIDLPTLQYTDAKVVLAACKEYGVDPYVPHGGSIKRTIASYTGLSFNATVKAFTNIRKCKG